MQITINSNYQHLVNEIVNLTDLPTVDVEDRLWMEILEMGWNVKQDAKKFNITPHVYDEKMEKLYKEGYGLIFETILFWARPERQDWIKKALERILLYGKLNNISPDKISILMLGDGGGSDSLYLVNNGFNVKYFDIPGSKTYDFAIKRFEKHGVLGKQVQFISDYNQCLQSQYDIVLSFEVLEHLTDPIQAIKDINSMLKKGGLALITEAFGVVADYHPTHLQSNLKYSHKTVFIFLQNKMRLSWYSKHALFKPMEFTKVEHQSILDLFRLVGDINVLRVYFYPKICAAKTLFKKIFGFSKQ
jgi:SAM-dependent methyltransferase